MERNRQKSTDAIHEMLNKIDISPNVKEAVLSRPTERSEDKWGLRSEAGQYISRTGISIIKMPDGSEVIREGIVDIRELADMLKRRR